MNNWTNYKDKWPPEKTTVKIRNFDPYFPDAEFYAHLFINDDGSRNATYSGIPRYILEGAFVGRIEPAEEWRYLNDDEKLRCDHRWNFSTEKLAKKCEKCGIIGEIFYDSKGREYRFYRTSDGDTDIGTIKPEFGNIFDTD